MKKINQSPKPKVYIIGSLRNENIPKIAATLRKEGFDAFDDWYAAGPEADDYWKKYEVERGRPYKEALDAPHAWHVFNFDKYHLDTSDLGLLVLPAGKSGHMELGYLIGSGKPGFIFLDTLDRWDVMYRFATKVSDDLDELVEEMKNV